MYCRYCGKQINDNSKFCPHCGCKCEGQQEKIIYVQKYDEKSEFERRRTENRVFGNLAVAFSIIFFPLGFIFSLIALGKYRDPGDPYHGGNLTKAFFGLGFSTTILLIIILAATGVLG